MKEYLVLLTVHVYTETGRGAFAVLPMCSWWRLPRRRRGRQGVRDGEPREHRVGGAVEEQDDDGEEAHGEHRHEKERAEELHLQR